MNQDYAQAPAPKERQPRPSIRRLQINLTPDSERQVNERLEIVSAQSAEKNIMFPFLSRATGKSWLHHHVPSSARHHLSASYRKVIDLATLLHGAMDAEQPMSRSQPRAESVNFN
jgi:hypothetical protein